LEGIPATSQVKVDVEKKVEKKVDQRANKKTDQAIDKGLDKLEEGIGSLFGKKKKKDKNQTEEVDQAQPTDGLPAEPQQASTKGPELNWAKYDFIPGDKVIFEDNQEGEENGEFPSRWDLKEGNIEIASLGGENVIMFRQYGSEIIPFMKDPKSDYLPEIFTIEFDLFIPNNSFSVYLFDRKNQSTPRGKTYVDVWGDAIEFNSARSSLPKGEKVNNQWAHIAIAYTNGKLKAYINETRLINVPRIEFEPTGVSMRALHSGEKNHFFIKNIRIAEGGVKYYDRFLQDGKIIANGIRFDVNKATLRPESMGIINEIADLMQKNPDIKFSVEGHTDSDGDDALNQTLSEQRAATVVSTLTKMGIDASRMTSKGWGESQPLDTNSTPEGKANNRRVEFVKI
ncbi:MAG TPA: OmpA family protein, partial [Mariniphaga anaerophila]|nr:OmpA family protein [Mariniphaga anaerophila]